jgi:hypothetical protein
MKNIDYASRAEEYMVKADWGGKAVTSALLALVQELRKLNKSMDLDFTPVSGSLADAREPGGMSG